MMSAFSVTGGRQNFPQMVFEDIHEFLNDIHGSRENSSIQTNMYFFYFPMDFEKLSFSHRYTLQSMPGQCEKPEWLCSFDNSESGKSSMQDSLACLPSLYLQKFFLFDDCFSTWLVKSWPGFFLSVCLQENSSDNKYTSALCLLARCSVTCSGSG